MTTTPIDAPAIDVPQASAGEKFMRYAKAHVAVIGAIAGILLNTFADTQIVHTYGTAIIGILTALGVYVVPNAPSADTKMMQANALAVQAQNPPEATVDVTAPVAPADLQDIPAPAAGKHADNGDGIPDNAGSTPAH